MMLPVPNGMMPMGTDQCQALQGFKDGAITATDDDGIEGVGGGPAISTPSRFGPVCGFGRDLSRSKTLHRAILRGHRAEEKKDQEQKPAHANNRTDF